MTEFVLYNAPQSTCGQRVQFVLNAKNLAFGEHSLDLFTGDQLKPGFDYLDDSTKRGSITTLADDTGETPDFRVGSQTEVANHGSDVRFAPDSVAKLRLR